MAGDDDAGGDSYLTGTLALQCLASKFAGALALLNFTLKVNFTFTFQLRTARGALKKDSSVGNLPLMSLTRFSHHCCHQEKNRQHMYGQEGIDRCKAFGAELWSPPQGHHHLWGER